MLSNSELFYQQAKNYQDTRVAIKATYSKTLEEISDLKGSERYNTEVANLETQRDAALDKAKADDGEAMLHTLQYMRDENSKRQIAGPSPEETQLLTVLTMRAKITRDELDQYSKGVTSDAGRGLLQELASKNGITKNYRINLDEMTPNAVNSILDGFEKEVRDFLNYDTVRASRIASEYYESYYGTPQALAPRPVFTSKSECFYQFTGLTGDALEAFISAVDGDTTKKDQGKREGPGITPRPLPFPAPCGHRRHSRRIDSYFPRPFPQPL